MENTAPTRVDCKRQADAGASERHIQENAPCYPRVISLIDKTVNFQLSSRQLGRSASWTCLKHASQQSLLLLSRSFSRMCFLHLHQHQLVFAANVSRCSIFHTNTQTCPMTYPPGSNVAVRIHPTRSIYSVRHSLPLLTYSWLNYRL